MHLSDVQYYFMMVDLASILLCAAIAHLIYMHAKCVYSIRKHDIKQIYNWIRVQ